MHIGPFALVSLLVAEGCVNAGYDPEIDQRAYVDAVMTMSLVCALIYLGMWALRLGFLVEILSDPTMSAMTTASAFLICTSQMRHFFGLTGIPRASFLETWAAIISKLPETNWVCVFIAVASLAMQVRATRTVSPLSLSLSVCVCVCVCVSVSAVSSPCRADESASLRRSLASQSSTSS